MLRNSYRLYEIIKIILTYGLDDVIPKKYIFFHLFRKLFFWLSNKHKSMQFSKRLRFTLEKLGPIWIKFGQMLSTRRDLFDNSIINQLENLQNNTTPFDGHKARKCIENSIKSSIDSQFNNFNITPIASASIAQIHTAKLKNGKEVIIKVIRPNIILKIKADIRLMLKIAKLISWISKYGKNLKLISIIKEYEKILLQETNLLYEAVNTMQLRRNFKKSCMLYIPKVYINYCSKTVMVVEKIQGIHINNISILKKYGINMKLLAERGVKIFFAQVFRDNFFHGDMHPGNILVSHKQPNNPKYIAIDCGIIGRLEKLDKYLLAENFIAFFNRDYRKIAKLHIYAGWVDKYTNINDLEIAIRIVCEPIFEKKLSDISFGKILLAFFTATRNFNFSIQPQLILLQKTLFYIEGIGKQLYPKLDLWKTAKPFLENWIKNEIGFIGTLRYLKKKLPFWISYPNIKYQKNMLSRFNLSNQKNKICTSKSINYITFLKLVFLFLLGVVFFLCSIVLTFFQKKTINIFSIVLIIFSICIWLYIWNVLKKLE
ncbi:2-octaprenylphenol hydroxylase of ubiquinone biosynthetic pathway [Wigglesworthia glossinidia endosymbiont of Glossina morsitans morsitans (Yale colony)]|uniref:2-octaprenylphenol hydroxylase of ubiquinone biosynthetic pathway n=1 Tax=Wigglesworthia glossinidia endosymbiont of Glossina morsitans morsitans (Yale colony) TaxID=1142511 RepID=H6Q4C7_WIGGL|nr:ubiquinone biosynthesis regulatory protein kinase UbiB [Wigglesworthia glossinidia]AFA40987.1 2-octaprenylphenol hydroxylase of ubiquinone biosynthetic pathway [Wigglesworthia glossinidia endosymbiont of Glossina morsitans morsitans (Yale colony)]